MEYDYLGYLLPQQSRSNIVLDGHMPARNDKPVFRTIFSMKLLIRQMTINGSQFSARLLDIFNTNMESLVGSNYSRLISFDFV